MATYKMIKLPGGKSFAVEITGDVTLGERECVSNNWSFPQVFENQYFIAPRGSHVPLGWVSVEHADWVLTMCPKIPLTRLEYEDGGQAGWVLGYAITADGQMLRGLHRISGSMQGDTLASFERFISELSGRFVALVTHSDQMRVYPDPTCGMGPVFDPTSRRLAASLALVLDRDIIDNPIVPFHAVEDGTTRYLFGHTRDAHARRIRANHYIDLSNFSEHRFWPTDDIPFSAQPEDFKNIAAQIHSKLAANIAALVQSFPCALPVTGGADSRIMLSSARPVLDRLAQNFVYHTNMSTRMDARIARRLAKDVGFKLNVYSKHDDVYDEMLANLDVDLVRRQRFLRGDLEPDTSEPGSIVAMQFVPSHQLILRGNVAEMTRALRWHRSVFNNPDNDEFALRRLTVTREKSGPYFDIWQEELLKWKKGLPDTAMLRLHDLTHTELWLPHANSTVYVRDRSHVMINPFNDRRLIWLTSLIEPSVRKRLKLVDELMALGLPEASEILWLDQLKAKKRADMNA